MTTKYVQRGETLDITNHSGFTVDIPQLIGDLFCMPVITAASGVSCPCIVEGVVTIPKSTGITFAQGDDVFWNVSAAAATATATDRFIGSCESAAASAATELSVKLIPNQAADANLADHLADTVGAHAASAISSAPGTTGLAAIEVDAALLELKGDTDDHLSDAVGAHAATAISSAPGTTGLAAIEVDAALAELKGEVDDNADSIAVLESMYAVDFVGSNGAGNVAVTTATAGVTPAAGDHVLAIVSGHVTSTPANGVALPVMGTDFAADLVDDSGIKITQASVSDLSANTYRAILVQV